MTRGKTPLLPDFSNPPVKETVLGVHFDPLAKFRNTHLGAFWSAIKSEWPDVTDAHALPSQAELFNDSAVFARSIGLLVTDQAPTRAQIRNADKTRMLQIQNGQFHYNWLGHGGEEYARYPILLQEFVSLFERFQCFVSSESVGDLTLKQWEVTYVNHFPRGSVWSKPSDWASLFRGTANLPAQAGGANLESFGGEWRYEIEPKRGRLYVTIQHGRTDGESREPLLIMTLTARGPIDDQGGMIRGLDLGRETIVRAFKDVTSEAAHQIWGLKNG